MLTSSAEAVGSIFSFALIIVLLSIASRILIYVFVIKAICKYMAKKNAEAFNYNYLAEKTAAEICRRMAIIEKERAKANKDATSNKSDPKEKDRAGTSEQNNSPQE